jgi:hypothetical protein
MKEEWLFPNAIIPVNVETTQALVVEIKRLIDVVGGMALECPNCEYHRQRAQRWREEAYKQAGHPLPVQDGECKYCTDGCPACDARKLPEQEPFAWYDPTNGMVSTDKDSPLFTPLGQVWPLYTKQEQEPVQVSPLEFVEMVMEKEHLVGKPVFWAEWPNKDKNVQR